MGSAKVKIALDAMGGDNAPQAVINGAALSLTRHPSVEFIFFGDEAQIAPLLKKHKKLQQASTIRHCLDVIPSDMRPSVALRNGRESSMRLAINAVAVGEADCVVSSGNTGALMALAKFVFKTLPGVNRPAICSFFPTLCGESVMLDLGANVECDADNLVQFAVMGSIFARAILGVLQPTIGLLNVGSEEIKGIDSVRLAASILREIPLPGRFHGFIEGDDIPKGTTDVVVTDGFTGNVALKIAEGTSKLYTEFLKQTFKTSWLARFGYLMSRSGFKKLKSRMDPRGYNGAMFLGLRGVCIKSHGGTDAVGFANAVGVAVDLIHHRINDKIKESMQATVLNQDSSDQMVVAQ